MAAMDVDAPQPVELVYPVPPMDARWVLEEADVPESPLHDAIIRLMVEVLLAWVRREGRAALVGSNVALRWDREHPRVGVDPDVYVVEPPPPEGEDATSLCTWKPGHHAPRVAAEVVSANTADKDYGDGPERYAASGVRELWVFDPQRAGPVLRGGPFVLQVWRRDDRGRFRRVYAGDGPTRSEELGAWLVVTDAGRRLRLADDRDGRALWPTAEEAERAARGTERAEKERAIAEVAVLRAELEKLRGA